MLSQNNILEIFFLSPIYYYFYFLSFCCTLKFISLNICTYCICTIWFNYTYSLSPFFLIILWCVSVQFSSVTQSCPTLCNPMNRSTPGLPVHHHLPEFIQTHVRWVRDAIQPSHPGSSPSSPAPNPSQHQSLFQWVNSSHEVAKLLEFQL